MDLELTEEQNLLQKSVREFAESEVRPLAKELDAALTRLHHPHDFAEFGIFNHTEISSGFGLGAALVDGSKLARLLIELMLAQS